MTGMTLLVTVLLALIGFVALTAWLTKVSAKCWKEQRFEVVVSWIVYAVVLGIAYGEFIWEELEPHRWREWLMLLRWSATLWAVIIALLFVLCLIWYAVQVARGTDDDEGLGFGRFGRPAERLVKRLLARRRAKPDTLDPRWAEGRGAMIDPVMS